MALNLSWRGHAAILACVTAGCAAPRAAAPSSLEPAFKPVVSPDSPVLDQRGAPVLEQYRTRLVSGCFANAACLDSSNAASESPARTRVRALDLSSTARAPLQTLALVAADRAVHVIAPKILEAAGRLRDAQRLANLPRVTSASAAGLALRVLESCIDARAAERAERADTARAWRLELGSQWATALPPEATREERVALALRWLSGALMVDPPAPCAPPGSELDCATPAHEGSLERAILSTLDALDIATRAGLAEADAESLAIGTLSELVETARHLHAP